MNSPIVPATLSTRDAPIPKDTPVGGTLSVSGQSYDLEIHGHGNWTWSITDKKPYLIKLTEKASLLGMDPNKDWALLANWSDRSFVNTALAMKLGRSLKDVNPACPWAPHWRFIDLTLNNAYVGIYQLVETVGLSSSRVDQHKVSAPTGIGHSGTYLMEINNEPNKAPWSTKEGVGIIFDDPDIHGTTDLTYIKNSLQGFETTLMSGGQYTQLMDLTSFAVWYVIEELASNQDSNYYGSCKMFKKQDVLAHGSGSTITGPLVMGPLWDFDIAFGNTVNISHAPDIFITRSTTAVWLTKMFEDPVYLAAVKTAWADIKHIIGADGAQLLAWMDTITKTLGHSPANDMERWKYQYSETGNWSFVGVDYNLYPTKKDWISARIIWMDKNYGI